MKGVIAKSKETVKSQLSMNSVKSLMSSLEHKNEAMKEYERSFADVPEKTQELKESNEDMLRMIDKHLKMYDE